MDGQGWRKLTWIAKDENIGYPLRSSFNNFAYYGIKDSS